MRVVVFGADSRVGQHLLPLLDADNVIDSVVAVGRLVAFRPSETDIEWHSVDRGDGETASLLQGADAVACLPPSTRWDPGITYQLIEHIAQSGTLHVIVASSVIAYAPASRVQRVDEYWPATGIPGSERSRKAADLEMALDRFESEHPTRRLVRLRFAFIPNPPAIQEYALARRRLTARGMSWLARLPFIPVPSEILFQMVGAADAARATHATLVRSVRGAINVATEPVLSPKQIATALGSRPLPISTKLARKFLECGKSARVSVPDPDWLELGVGLPLVDSSLARHALEWRPMQSSLEVLHQAVAELQSLHIDRRDPPSIVRAIRTPKKVPA